MTIIIDNEFEAMIPPLTAEELPELTESIKTFGCRDALVLWGDILIDGHNRYRICTEAGIPYKTVSIELKDRDAAKAWIITNQLARRNLEAYQRAKLAFIREGIYRDQAKEKQLSGLKQGDALPVLVEKCARERNRENETDYRLAREAGVSPSTIRKVRVIEREAPEEVKAALAAGKTTIGNEYKKLRPPKAKHAWTAPEAGGGEDSTKPEREHSPVSDAVYYADLAILQLQRIRDDDPKGISELDRVIVWSEQRKRELTPVVSTGAHETTGPCVAMLHADNTIMQLEKIPPNDIERTAALERVLAWVTAKMQEHGGVE